MIILAPSTKDKVYATWLKSELYRMKSILAQDEVQIIENPDFGSSEEDSKREELLLNKYGRGAILKHIPSEIVWYEVTIENGDIEKLHILAIWDWFVDTGRTFKLSKIPGNLTSSHGHKVANLPPGAADHKSKIDTMSHSMIRNIQDIVLISTSLTGPFTIIDGTHRASLLTIRGDLAGTKAYLGVANDLSQCVWVPDWINYQASLDELNRLVDGGYIW